MRKIWKIGCIGAGGQAARLIKFFETYVDPSRAALAAVRPSSPAEAAANQTIRALGVRCVDTVEELMSGCGLDAIIVPTSIHSHLDYTLQAIDHGLHVLLEKPVAGTVDEVDRMIEARDRGGMVVAVGYQGSYAPSTQWAKERIASGAIGRPRRARAMGLWPRSDSYYARNNWAGGLQRDGRWVLDSPANNALAHQINFLTYLTTEDRWGSNTPTWVEAELYRARPNIENYDTCAIHCGTVSGCDILALLTHACDRADGPALEIDGELGSLRRTDASCRIVTASGAEERYDIDCPEKQMFENFFDRLDGKIDRVLCELENARNQTLIINGASECAPVRPVPSQYVTRVTPEETPEGEVFFAIDGIAALFAACFEQFKMPHASGLAPWAAAPGKIELAGYRRFSGLAQSACWKSGSC